MKHPNEDINENQAKFLEELPEKERPFHSQLFRIGNASYIYHLQAKPNESDFEQWLEGLPENIRKDMRKKGFESCKNILPFTRFLNEKNDIGMDSWMKEHLSKADYSVYKNKKK